jgi:hypothetical protein
MLDPFEKNASPQPLSVKSARLENGSAKAIQCSRANRSGTEIPYTDPKRHSRRCLRPGGRSDKLLHNFFTSGKGAFLWRVRFAHVCFSL